MKNWLPILVLAFSLQGCATSYQSAGLSGGFSETQLDKNIFRVAFYGNGYTGKERVTDFTLLRSAELTLEYGYKYFVIIDSSNLTVNDSYTTPLRSHSIGSAYSSGNYIYGNAITTTSGGETYTIAKPGLVNTIICITEKPEKVFAYDAEFIFRKITQKYEIQRVNHIH